MRQCMDADKTIESFTKAVERFANMKQNRKNKIEEMIVGKMQKKICIFLFLRVACEACFSQFG